MNWEPTLLILGAYLLLIGLYLAASLLVDRSIGWDEAGKRWKLIRLAASGKDYRQPDLDPGMFTTRSFDAPGQADDPITAMLVRASEAERRWYALHHLIDQWESEGKHQRMMQAQEERAIHDFLRQQHRQAIEEAKEAIRSRMELTHFTDEDGLQERFIIEDPATDYRIQVQMSARDLVRFDTASLDVGDHQDVAGISSMQPLPPAVQQRIDSFPDQVLREVEQRSETQHCWV